MNDKERYRNTHQEKEKKKKLNPFNRQIFAKAAFTDILTELVRLLPVSRIRSQKFSTERFSQLPLLAQSRTRADGSETRRRGSASSLPFSVYRCSSYRSRARRDRGHNSGPGRPSPTSRMIRGEHRMRVQQPEEEGCAPGIINNKGMAKPSGTLD